MVRWSIYLTTTILIGIFQDRFFVIGKVFEKCELANILRNNYELPIGTVASLVCIAEYYSQFNSSARTGNSENGAHGLFQISDTHWCSPPGGGWQCGISCEYLRDDQLADDLICVKLIFEETQRISNDGFSAWPMYSYFCKGKEEKYIAECFANKLTSFTYNTTEAILIKTTDIDLVNRREKIYDRCELAQELRNKHNLPIEQIPIWVCIAHYESSFNTSAVGNMNLDGSSDHGLFQISDSYWCSPPGYGWACGVSCKDLEDSDISDDIACAKKIYQEHERISGDGFNAWTVYDRFCKGRSENFIYDCFDEIDMNFLESGLTTRSSQKRSTDDEPYKRTGGNKAYKACELASELRTKHKIPEEQIATWVCIAKKESNLMTSAVGGDNYGLFQISNVYWCSRNGAGKACEIACSDLLDDDITDDIDCAKKVFDEHQRLFGDGFQAWSAYRTHCKYNSEKYIEYCENDIAEASSPKYTVIKRKNLRKVFERCELAYALKYKFHLPSDQIGTWVCLAKYESNYSTSIVGQLKKDGSRNHGIFQINDKHWCAPNKKGNGCDIKCSDMTSDDITDTINCIKKIHKVQTKISGNGFDAWSMYRTHCDKKSEKYIEGCFDNPTHKIKTTTLSPKLTTRGTTIKPTNQPKKKTGKVYKACELANELLKKHRIPREQIATWVCIAKHESNFRTSVVGRLNADGSGDHGLFQISDIYWCSESGAGKACNVACSDLEDDDITDDVECVRAIFEEHQRLFGDGFHAWAVYNPHCKWDVDKYITGCFDDESPNSIKPNTGWTTPRSVSPKHSPKKKTGKVYKACELANELLKKHRIPREQIATWVCIAKHESNFRTSVVGRLNADGSGDHGLFQISDIYWCSESGAGKACNVACSDLEDDDITDDVECVRAIFEEHQRLFGDGFHAWAVYNPHCKWDVDKYIKGCFDDESPNSIKPNTGWTTPRSVTPKHSPKKKTGKVYKACELANELLKKHRIPREQIATWVCIAKHESNFRTSAVGRLNADGSGDHGLFQISDIYWCSESGAGKACNVACSDLEDDNITDDVQCVRAIFEEHQRLFGDGFHAWAVYNPHCKWDVDKYITGCFDDESPNSIKPNSGWTTPRSVTPKHSPKKKTGKVYTACELANELLKKHRIPREQIATWVCIAKHESNFRTSAVGRLNADGSGDHGLFQISDIYWCSESGAGKACNVACSDLEDDNITDDVQCVRAIFEEHQRLFGDGFHAWAVYNPYCKWDVDKYITGCFDDSSQNEIKLASTLTTSQTVSQNVFFQRNSGKVYKACELANELLEKHRIPREQIAVWVCIAKHGANFKTFAVGDLNSDGTSGHGLFQINGLDSCAEVGSGKTCNIACSDLEDQDITNDVECIKKVYNKHKETFGDGFSAWPAYSLHCTGDVNKYIVGCFDDENIISIDNPWLSFATITPTYEKPKEKTNKVYTPCELATELSEKHNIPEEQIATWVCIAKHESNFDTSAVGRLNADGSTDHGLFQISDIYWCSLTGKGKACGLSCSDLENDDISDDVRCIKKIHSEHQKLSGNGFNAWTVYSRHCKGRSESYIKDCIIDSTTQNAIFTGSVKPGVTAPTKFPNTRKADSRTITTSRPSTTTTKIFRTEKITQFYNPQKIITTTSRPITTRTTTSSTSQKKPNIIPSVTTAIPKTSTILPLTTKIEYTTQKTHRSAQSTSKPTRRSTSAITIPLTTTTKSYAWHFDNTVYPQKVITTKPTPRSPSRIITTKVTTKIPQKITTRSPPRLTTTKATKTTRTPQKIITTKLTTKSPPRITTTKVTTTRTPQKLTTKLPTKAPPRNIFDTYFDLYNIPRPNITPSPQKGQKTTITTKIPISQKTLTPSPKLPNSYSGITSATTSRLINGKSKSSVLLTASSENKGISTNQNVSRPIVKRVETKSITPTTTQKPKTTISRILTPSTTYKSRISTTTQRPKITTARITTPSTTHKSRSSIATQRPITTTTRITTSSTTHKSIKFTTPQKPKTTTARIMTPSTTHKSRRSTTTQTPKTTIGRITTPSTMHKPRSSTTTRKPKTTTERTTTPSTTHKSKRSTATQTPKTTTARITPNSKFFRTETSTTQYLKNAQIQNSRNLKTQSAQISTAQTIQNSRTWISQYPQLSPTEKSRSAKQIHLNQEVIISTTTHKPKTSTPKIVNTPTTHKSRTSTTQYSNNKKTQQRGSFTTQNQKTSTTRKIQTLAGGNTARSTTPSTSATRTILQSSRETPTTKIGQWESIFDFFLKG